MPPGLPGASGHSLLLEEPLIRTPYELLRRSHRSAQRQVEKDFMGVQSVLNGLLKSFDDKPISQEKRLAVNNKLDQGLERVRGLKRKLDELQPSETKPSALKARLRYLDAIIASGATDREVEVKIEPPEEGSKPIIITVADVSGSRAVSGGVKDASAVVKEEEDVVMPERAASPLAPEPVPEDKNIARYLVDYLLRQGHVKTAQAVAETANIESLVDINLFSELRRIEDALVKNHSVAEALAWCGENRGTLKKTKNNLEFTLRMQEYIELCRARKIEAAILYSRKNLAPWAATYLRELQQAMTLLAFGEKAGVATYRQLYADSRWGVVRDQFRETFLALYGLPSQPLLCLSLFAGLASIRLPSCGPALHLPTIRPPRLTHPMAAEKHHEWRQRQEDVINNPDSLPWAVQNEETILLRAHRDKASEPRGGDVNADCPTCDPHLAALAAKVPMSHHVNSTIVCRISGEVMDSSNEPLAFPNGYVYSFKALRHMANSNFDVVTCPRTGESCSFTRLRKVYIS